MAITFQGSSLTPPTSSEKPRKRGPESNVAEVSLAILANAARYRCPQDAMLLMQIERQEEQPPEDGGIDFTRVAKSLHAQLTPIAKAARHQYYGT